MALETCTYYEEVLHRPFRNSIKLKLMAFNAPFESVPITGHRYFVASMTIVALPLKNKFFPIRRFHFLGDCEHKTIEYEYLTKYRSDKR